MCSPDLLNSEAILQKKPIMFYYGMVAKSYTSHFSAKVNTNDSEVNGGKDLWDKTFNY